MHLPTPTYLPTLLLLLTTETLADTTSLLTCNQDNQLRALERFSTQASTFCPTYLSPLTTATTTSSIALPSYISAFQDPDIISACACFQASATVTDVVLTFTSASMTATATATEKEEKGSKGGLSAGAKAGIGIACAVVALIAIALVAAFLSRRRKRGASRQQVRGGRGAEGIRRDGGVEGAGRGWGEGARNGGAAAQELPPAYDALEKDTGEGGHEVEGRARFELRGDKTGGGA